MRINFLPALSDQLNDHDVNAAQLYRALEDYAEAIDQFIELNHDQYERPLEYLEVKDFQATVLAFLKLLPLVVPEDDLEFTDEDDD